MKRLQKNMNLFLWWILRNTYCKMRFSFEHETAYNCHIREQKGVLEKSILQNENEWVWEEEKIHKVFQMYDESRTNVHATYSVNHVSYFLFYFFFFCAYCALVWQPYSKKNLQYNNLIFFFFFFITWETPSYFFNF